ncbi:MAG TPA: tetratricopeptide repeat protein, partial [Pyrinomonadaceae bacterium]|nr:tetratricopeptide repeat protein [Pyrinomonadaceae bacterium]
MRKRFLQLLVQTVVAVLLCVFTVVAQTSTEQPVLSDVTRELKGGETHSYRISLTANQFLHAVVIQEGIDIVTVAFAPDNKQLTESDSPSGDWGVEPVVIVASTPGEYRVDVRAPDGKAPAGRYRIKIIALRDATSIDKDHANAQLLFDEARKLRVQQNAAAKRAAIEKYQQALPAFRAAEDTERQALTLYSIGLSYRGLNEPRATLEYFNQTLPLVIAIGDRRLEATTETNIGGMLQVLGDVGKALEHQHRALQLAREIGFRVTEGSALTNIGRIFNDLADWQTALEFYAQALTVFKEIGLKQFEAITLNNIGVAYDQSGEQQKALEYLEQSLPLLRAAGNKNSEAYTLLNIGRVYRRLGDLDKALSYYEQALAIQQQTGNRADASETLDEFGVVYSAKNQYDKAFAHHRQSLEIQRAMGNVRREAVALTNLGNTYRISGDPEKAVEQYNQALAIFRNIDDLSNAAVALEGIARAEQKRGKFADARKYIEESLALRETVRSRSGSLQLRASYRATIEKAYEFYIDVLMQQKLDADALHASERGRARSLLEQLSEARINIRQGVDAALIEKERDLTRVLNAKAQREMQLKAGKGSSEEITRLQHEISELEDQHQQVQAAIRKSSPQYSALTQPQPLDLKGIQRELDANTVLLEYSLGEERSYVWVITQNSLKTYALPKRQEVENVARRINGSLAARSVVKALESPAERRTRIAGADAEFEKAASELSRMILAPAAAEFGKKRLLVVADGALQYVPFAALSTASNRPLIVDHELVSLPSASAFALQRQILANRPLAPETVAVIADPVFSTNDVRLGGTAVKESASTRIIEHGPGGPGGQLSIPRLPFTRWEADQILAVSPAGSTLKAVGFNANRAVAGNGELSHYRYLHFATHGYVDTARAGF